jgi:N-acylneuraminate cytidylyltransferase
MKKLMAVIAVRAGSRRVKNKNIRPFGESNLLVHKIRQLKQIDLLDGIIVSSDSDVMLEMAKEEGVLVHKRAPEYCDEKTKTMGEVIAHICENIDCENVMWAPCTTPLVSPDQYILAINTYYKKVKEGYDSLLSVEEVRLFLRNLNGPINYEQGKKQVPSQQLKPLYIATGGIYIAPRTKMIEWNYYIGPKPYSFILDKYSSMDIDDELDFECAKAWYGLKDWNNVKK